jgi:WD40 repeat protein
MTRRERVPLRGRTNNVTSVAFSPNGKRIVTGSEDRTVKVWNAQTGQEIRTLRGHTELVEEAERVRPCAFDAAFELMIAQDRDQEQEESQTADDVDARCQQPQNEPNPCLPR